MVHELVSEPFDVLLDELEVSLVRLDGVDQVVFIDCLLGVSQERADGLDAARALQVLGGKQLVKVLLEIDATVVAVDLQHLQDSHEHLLEALEVPVLINDSMDDSREEDLLGLVGEQVHQVVHLVDGLEVRAVFLAPLRKDLLADQVYQILDVLVVGQVHVLPRVLEADFDFVHKRATH